jgi:acyl-CoA synthetase (AMP-forming)/AMP-acid ligase II
MGGTVILNPPPWKSQNFISALKKYSPNSTFLVPTQIRDLLLLDKKKLQYCSVLSSLISSGSPLHKHERKKVINYICPGLIEYYASTEGGGISALFANEMKIAPDSVGKPIFRVEVSITDQKSNEMPKGKIGLIRYRGPAVASNKRLNTETKKNYQNDGDWFYPGDLGELCKDGYLYLRGRAKDLIIRGGVNIYPQEIETVMAKISGIKEVSIFSLPDPHYGEIVAAAVVTEIDESIEKIIQKCSKLLAPYKVPSTIIRVNQLPKNSGGKILKAKLQKIVLAKKK